MKIIILLITIFNTSISSSKSLFTNKTNEIKALKSIYVVTDTTMVELISKSKYGLNEDYNLKLGKQLFNVIEKTLKNKTNADFTHSLNTIGLKNQENVYFLDYKDHSKKLYLPLIDKENLFPKSEQFLIETNQIADKAYDSSNPSFGMHKKYQKKMLKNQFLTIKKLGLEDGEAVLILLTSGVKVPTKTTIKGAVVSSILTLGMLTIAKVSVTNMNILLISNKGELIWAGKVLRQGTFGSNWKQTLLFKKTLKGFPKI